MQDPCPKLLFEDSAIDIKCVPACSTCGFRDFQDKSEADFAEQILGPLSEFAQSCPTMDKSQVTQMGWLRP